MRIIERQCKAKKGCWDNESIFVFGFVDCRNLKTLDKLTDQPGNLIPLDRGGVSDLSVSGDNFNLVEDDPHDPTTTSEPKALMQSLNQLPKMQDQADHEDRFLSAIKERKRKRCEQSNNHSKVEF
jgi:hypothetical protein